MAYDAGLAERVRTLLAPEVAFDETRMFGGLAFLVGGNMAVCVSGQGGLMVRVDAAEQAALVAADGVAPMQMAGRTSRTWVVVDDAVLADDLGTWVSRGLATARSLPPKNR